MYNINRSVQKHEAWLIAKGYSYQGIDLDNTFSSIVRFETMKTFLALVVYLSWHVYHFDVKSIILNRNL